MSKRKLDTKRLYKFGKILTIVLTIYFLLAAGYAYFETITFYNSENLAILGLEKIEKMNLYLKLAFFIPLIFFGGSWLFKYLFPKK